MDSQALRLQYILTEIKVTPYKFSKILEYKNPASIYHVLNGIQEISTSMQKRIRETNFEINENWLLTGSGTPFIKRVIKGQYGNEYSSKGMVIYPSRLGFEDVRLVSKGIARVLFNDEEEHSYDVKARPSGIEGLELIYTTFSFEDGKKYLSEHFSVLIAPDWKITQYFDFWRVEKLTRRCQNLLEISNESRLTYHESFETELRNVLDSFDDKYYDYNDREISFTHKSKDEDGFVLVYSTDGRK